MIKKLKKYLDFKLIGILSLVYLTFVIIYSLKNAYFRVFMDRKTNWGDFVFNNILDWCLITIFMVFIAITTKYLMSKKTKLIFIAFIHLFFSFFIGAFTIGVSLGVDILRDPSVKFSFEELSISFIRLVDLHFLIYISLVALIYMYYYLKKVEESKIHTIKLQEQLSKSHLKFLQSQMHPHFLFNTLNGIHSLMDINIEKSKSMVVDLSDLLRNVLDKKDQNLIELQEELEILKKYIHIKKTRFSDQLKIHLSIEAGLENVLVPNMLIQSIVENSTKHGYSDNHISLDIFISIYKKNENLVIKVENNGTALKDTLSELLKKGTGLSNIKKRLLTLYKENHELSISNSTNKVVTKISFPIELSISEIEKNY